MKLSDIVNDTVHCTRKYKDGHKCEAEIPITEENLNLMRPEVPVVSVICPECRYSNAFDKETSIVLRDKFFPDVTEQPGKEGSTKEGGTGDESLSPDDFMPSVTIARGIEKAMGLLGYKSQKWQEKIKAIKEFTHSNQLYQTPDGLQQLLFMMQIEASHIPLIVKQAFGAVTPPSPLNLPPFQQSGSPTNAPGTPGGYTVHALPTGQVIVIPPQNAPAPARESQQIVPLSGDMEIVEEKLDRQGNVISRTTRRTSTKEPEDKGSDLLTTIRTLKELGIIPTTGGKDESKSAEALAAMMVKLDQKAEDRFTRPEPSREDMDEKLAKMEDRIVSRVEEKRKKEDEMRDLKEDLSAEIRDVTKDLREEIKSVKANKPETGYHYPPEKAELAARQETLKTITGAVETAGAKMLEPIIAMQKEQIKMNTLLVVRQMEQQDQVAPGTYVKVLQPAAPPSDAEVQETVSRWKNRAKEVKGVPPTEGGAQ